MKLGILIIVVLAIIVIAQLAKLYNLSLKLKNQKEENVTPEENKGNAIMMLGFMAFLFIGTIYLTLKYGKGGLGPSGSEHGVEMDKLYNFNWLILFLVFFITQSLLFVFSYKYYYRADRKATFFAHSNKLELVWTVIPAVVLAVIIIYGLSIWNKITGDTPQNAKVIELYAKQFDWTARYSGEDNTLGKSDFKAISTKNPLGVLTKDVLDARKAEWLEIIKNDSAKIATEGDLMPDADLADLKGNIKRLKRQLKRLQPLIDAQTPEDDRAANDDVISKELVLIKGQPYELKFRSRDVIHSAYFPHFRAQMNCVPGMVTRFVFTPRFTTEEMRKQPGVIETYNQINEKRKKQGKEPVEFEYLLLCNKICGAAHSNMQMKIKVVGSEQEYNAWVKEQKNFKTLISAN